ncbi:S-layer homology domain-containing protein [Paenibacillus sp. N1-5-1-14]|uniref:S-layer homology domain-containing protein n=1 Tax=Paenibacillus radicibacter TaxID=2972488 RepID=UPI0021591DBD|nr:S-layer homology domain-containing protein [Paenibacillus radicibacter]MCR8642965.1 S-layer homology domain-containing protein [Paenibacillus radicibacter]
MNELYKQIKNKYAKMLAVMLSISIVFSLFSYPLVPTALAAGTPYISSVSVPANGTYGVGSALVFAVNFDQPVNVDTTGGTPAIGLTIGSKQVGAAYTSGSGTSVLTFRYTIQQGDFDLDGIAIRPLVLNGGTIRDAQNTDANLTLNGVGSTTGLLIDARYAVVSTNAVTNVTSTSAVVGGNVTSDGGTVITERGIVLSTSSNPTKTTFILKTIFAGTTGSYTATTMLVLTPGTTYYVRAYATNSVGTSYGNEVSFTTPLLYNVARVLTNLVTSVTSTSAEVGGSVTSDGGTVITERGIVYSTSSNPTTASTKKISTGTTGSYTVNLTGLTAATTYYVRAYATNSVGTSYGDNVSFTTRLPNSLATITTNPVTSVTSTSVEVGGSVTSDGGAAVTERGIVYSTSSNPTIADMKIGVAGTTGSYTTNLSGLTAGTTYYVRAFATNSVGTSYGSEVNFKTLAIIPPIATVTSMSLDKHTGTMRVGDTFTVVATATMSDTTTQDITSQITWAANDPSKVSIHNGVITALQSGTVKVQAKYSGNPAIIDYVNLTITNPSSFIDNNYFNDNITTIPVTSVSVNSSSNSVYKGSTLSLVASVLPNTATNSHVVWTVNPGTGMATISSSGLLTGVANGTVTVVASSTDGTQVRGSKVITVLESPADNSLIFTPVVKWAKAVSEITKKLEDSKAAAIHFNDTDSHWAANTVKLFTKLGVVKGYEDGTFRPNDSITRGEFAAIIYRVFGLSSAAYTELLDVKGHWSEEAVTALSSNGIISGYEDGTFKPDSPITRAEIISIISKLVVLKTAPSQDIFKDIDEIWNEEQIKAAASMGLVNGQSTDHFAPQSNATRGEALTMIMHVLELDPSLKFLFKK